MTRILDCDLHASGECPAGEHDIRVCTVCLKAVYRCANAEEAQLRLAAGHRAAVVE